MAATVEARLHQLIQADAARMDLLERVHALGLPDCWIGAGFVRSAVWDHLHGRPSRLPATDVDVVWFDRTRADEATDLGLETTLRAGAVAGDVVWSVKNQARMHRRNGDAPYGSVEEAMRHWPETATAVALRRTEEGLEVLAPFGLADLFSLRLRPTPAFAGDKHAIFESRVKGKQWLERWPNLVVTAL